MRDRWSDRLDRPWNREDQTMRASCRNAFCRWWQRQMSNVVAALLATAVCSSVYLAFFDTNNPRVLESGTRDINGHVKREFRAGEVLYVYRHFCVDRVVAGDADVEIVSKSSGAFWYLGTRATGARKGCSQRTSANQLPPDLPLGTYIFRSRIQFTVNPMRTVVYELPDIEFEVVP